MKYRIFNKKTRTYYKSTPFKGQFHWESDKAHIFKKAQDALNKIMEIVSIKRLTIYDLVIERVK